MQTGARARDVGRKAQKGRGPEVTVSVSIHVPKPHTPFQWCAMDERETVVTKQSWLREEAKRTGVKLRVAQSVPGASVNDIIDPARIDELSGTSALSGQPVDVRPA